MAGWSTRAFQALLSLYPRGFRDEYGREIALLFADRYRHASSAGERALIWLDSLSGLAREAPKEHCRMILQDLRYAVRTLSHHPLFAATIVLTLALGIGANSAIFSLLNAVTLRTLPLPEPAQLYAVRIDSPTPAPQRFSWPVFEKLRAAAPPQSAAALSRVARVHVRIDSEREPASAQLVSGEYFRVLRVRTALGRPLGPEDNVTPGAHPVAVISHGYWQRRFGGSGDVLGKQLTVNNSPFTVIGVAEEGHSGFWLESPVDVWVPIAMQHDIRYYQNFSAHDASWRQPWMSQQNISWLDIVVRAKNSVPLTASLNETIRRLMPQMDERRRLALEPAGTGFSRLRERFLNPLYALMAMAGLVLLIACANAANLLLARAEGRQREIAVRLSLGAGRVRLVQQLLTESLVLVALAGVLGLVVSRWSSALLVRMATATADGPAPFTMEADLRVLGFNMALALLSTLLFGLAPALRSTRVDVTGTLKSGSRGVLGGVGHARILVVAQVALSLILVSGTALLIRSFRNMAAFELGFDRERVLTVELALQLMPVKTPEEIAGIQRRIMDRLTALPGVRSASWAMCGVQRGCRSVNGGYSVEGYQTAPREQISFLINLVGPDYFDTMGMRLIEGRVIDRRDIAGSPGVVVVNETAARKYFAGRSAIGQRIGMDGKLTSAIAGVVRDARVLGVRDEPMAMAFYALAQGRQGGHVIEVRTQGDPQPMIATVRRAMAEAAPEVPVSRIVALADQVSANLSQERLVVSLSSAFGALALGLAGFGLFGTLSFAVARRTAEFGIRIALGASGGRVVWSVCREALVMVLVGVALGLPAVLFGARAMRTLLFGVTPNDWSAFAGAGAVLLAVAAVAGLLPAWRASRVDPVIALRMD